MLFLDPPTLKLHSLLLLLKLLLKLLKLLLLLLLKLSTVIWYFFLVLDNEVDWLSYLLFYFFKYALIIFCLINGIVRLVSNFVNLKY